MTKYYLRVEAVNISNFVYDTHDISTIRGGSYLLLDAIESLSEEFSGLLTPVSTAASQGLFWFDGRDDNQELQKDILAFLQRKTGGHATFLAATHPDIPGEFGKVLEILEAKIHRQQWRMPSVAIPAPAATSKECHLDGWRPGVEAYPFDADARISEAAAFRWQQGVQFKRHFFAEILGDESYQSIITTNDLGELAADKSKGILDGKIAFIHVDGNSFGRIRRAYCKTEESRRQFDESFQDDFRKNEFLKALLQIATSDPDFQTEGTDGNPALRLEILLWGGDEMTLVVPAWQGWRVMRLFYKMARDLQFKESPLSQRAAVIFCHHNAPILLIRQLAEDLLGVTKADIQARLGEFSRYNVLGEEEKERLKAQLNDHTLGDALHYLVLESFDLLRGDIRQFLSAYYRGCAYSNLLIHAAELDEVLKSVHIIQTHVSRGKALKVIEAIQQKDKETAKKITKEIYDLLPGEDKPLVKAAVATLTKDQTCLERWYMATDLWDYVSEGDIS